MNALTKGPTTDYTQGKLAASQSLSSSCSSCTTLTVQQATCTLHITVASVRKKLNESMKHLNVDFGLADIR